MKILFCCIGNTCRSPMAENIAKNVLKNSNVESAGLRVTAQEVNPNTILVLKEKYGIDVSSYQPRKIDEIELNDFDSIVALDKEVYEHLELLVESSKLQYWNIEDPFGEDYPKYLEVQKLLDEKINNLIKC